MITKENLAFLKKELEDEKADLEIQIKDTERAPDFGHDTDHFEEAADAVEEESKNMGLGQAFKERLMNVTRALQKMDAGTYGKCETCGNNIEWELLKVDPESRLCKGCKKMKN
jgi:RNA polymerase-binding transcription factor DksA